MPAKPSALVDTRVIYCCDQLEQLRKLPDGCVDLIYIVSNSRTGSLSRSFRRRDGGEIRPQTMRKIHERSERVIATLLPEVRPYARALIGKAAAAGITIKVISGLRTYDEQNALYAQGRDKPGRVVTNARGGYSNHNFGIAFDIGVFEGAKYLDESPKYKAVGVMGAELGLEWGGNWKSIQDQPHFQLRPRWAATMPEREMLGGLRSRKESGQGAYA